MIDEKAVTAGHGAGRPSGGDQRILGARGFGDIGDNLYGINLFAKFRQDGGLISAAGSDFKNTVGFFQVDIEPLAVEAEDDAEPVVSPFEPGHDAPPE